VTKTTFFGKYAFFKQEATFLSTFKLLLKQTNNTLIKKSMPFFSPNSKAMAHEFNIGKLLNTFRKNGALIWMP